MTVIIKYILLRNLYMKATRLPVSDVIHDAKCRHLHDRLKQENWSKKKIEEFQDVVKLLQSAQTKYSDH